MKNVAIKINEVTVLKKKKKEIRLRFTSPVIQTLAGSRRKIDSSSGFETQDWHQFTWQMPQLHSISLRSELVRYFYTKCFSKILSYWFHKTVGVQKERICCPKVIKSGFINIKDITFSFHYFLSILALFLFLDKN